jgi:hypothetical protein
MGESSGTQRRGTSLCIEKEVRCGTTHPHHPKPVVVVAVVWMVVVTVGGAGVVVVVDERAAAQDAPVARWPQVCRNILEGNLI